MDKVTYNQLEQLILKEDETYIDKIKLSFINKNIDNANRILNDIFLQCLNNINIFNNEEQNKLYELINAINYE